MALIQWSDEIYSVGIRKMDEQHKQLVGLVNLLYTQKYKPNPEFMDKVFATLVQYTLQHFADEEKILQKLHFPAFEPHHLQHVNFIRQVSVLKADYEKQPANPELIEKLCKFLGEWLTHHILIEDKAYCAYLEG